MPLQTDMIYVKIIRLIGVILLLRSTGYKDKTVVSGL
jgi:hypothetical protein